MSLKVGFSPRLTGNTNGRENQCIGYGCFDYLRTEPWSDSILIQDTIEKWETLVEKHQHYHRNQALPTTDAPQICHGSKVHLFKFNSALQGNIGDDKIQQ